nr:restriction endonuclease subunit S [Rhizobium sp. RU33A]
MTSSWTHKPLREIMTLQRGFDLPKKERREGQVPIISSSGAEDFHAVSAKQGPGVVTGRYGTIGKVFYSEEPYWPLNTTLFVSNFHGNSPRYCYYLLSRLNFREHSGKTGVPGVNRNDLHTVEMLTTTDTREQEAIAEALWDMDTLIEALEGLIAKKRLIKQGVMQDLLTGKRRLPGFPEEWVLKTLGDFAHMKSGEAITSACITENGEFPVYGGNGLRGYTSTFNKDGECTLVGRQGALCGAVTHTSGRIFASEHAIVCKAISGNSQRYLSHLFEFLNLNRVSEASAQPGLSVEKIRKIEVRASPREGEQERIAQILDEMDAEIRALESRSKKARRVKEGMMQNLLTGRIRLI